MMSRSHRGARHALLVLGLALAALGSPDRALAQCDSLSGAALLRCEVGSMLTTEEGGSIPDTLEVPFGFVLPRSFTEVRLASMDLDPVTTVGLLTPGRDRNRMGLIATEGTSPDFGVLIGLPQSGLNPGSWVEVGAGQGAGSLPSVRFTRRGDRSAGMVEVSFVNVPAGTASLEIHEAGRVEKRSLSTSSTSSFTLVDAWPGVVAVKRSGTETVWRFGFRVDADATLPGGCGQRSTTPVRELRLRVSGLADTGNTLTVRAERVPRMLVRSIVMPTPL